MSIYRSFASKVADLVEGAEAVWGRSKHAIRDGLTDDSFRMTYPRDGEPARSYLDHFLATALHEAHEDQYKPHDAVERAAMRDAVEAGIYSPALARTRARQIGVTDTAVPGERAPEKRDYLSAFDAVASILRKRGVREYQHTDGPVTVDGTTYEAYRFPDMVAHSVSGLPAAVRKYLGDWTRALRSYGIVVKDQFSAPQGYALGYAGRPTGQIALHPDPFIALLGRYSALLFEIERVAWERMQTSGNSGETLATTYGIAPWSKMRPTGVSIPDFLYAFTKLRPPRQLDREPERVKERSE